MANFDKALKELNAKLERQKAHVAITENMILAITQCSLNPTTETLRNAPKLTK